MNKPQKNNKNIDDQLANYTDTILNKETAKEDENPLSSSSDLCALEKTALRLKQAYHDDGPSDEVIQRMRKNIAQQWQQQENRQAESFWSKWLPVRQKWQSKRSRQRLYLAISLTALSVVLLVCIPFFNEIDSNQPATSGQYLNNVVLAVSVGLIFIAIWLVRRK